MALGWGMRGGRGQSFPSGYNNHRHVMHAHHHYHMALGWGMRGVCEDDGVDDGCVPASSPPPHPRLVPATLGRIPPVMEVMEGMEGNIWRVWREWRAWRVWWVWRVCSHSVSMHDLLCIYSMSQYVCIHIYIHV